MRRSGPALIVAIVTLGLAGCMQQQAQPSNTITYKAHLIGAMEVPPTTSAGSGDGVFTFNTTTKQLTWDVKFAGLTGPAIASHIHGPAAVGVNAGVVVPFKNVPAAPAGEITGGATLTDAQIADLKSGKWYANVHTAANKGGEIRGQLAP